MKLGDGKMMDYCAKESTINPYPCEDEIRSATIKMDIQETFKILKETRCALDEFAQIVNGKRNEDKTQKDASCLLEEARLLTALAYDNLKVLLEIKGSII